LDSGPKKKLVQFLAEDIGKEDITSALLPKKKVRSKIISRQKAIIAGVIYAKEIFSLKKSSVKMIKKDGDVVFLNQTILEVYGTPQAILSCERTALNLLSRMSGIATQTNMLVKKIRKINSKIDLYATRKTAPGLRFFDKEAVRIGGGRKHRNALDEMIMLKDNHLAIDSISNLIQKAKKKFKKIEIEVSNANEAVSAAKEGVHIIMLDNFSPKQISKTVTELKKLGLRHKVKLEASGGIHFKNIEYFARTGVDMISVGEITHSVRGVNLSLEIMSKN